MCKLLLHPPLPQTTPKFRYRNNKPVVWVSSEGSKRVGITGDPVFGLKPDFGFGVFEGGGADESKMLPKIVP